MTSSGQLTLFELAPTFEQLALELSKFERTTMNHSPAATIRRGRARLAGITLAVGGAVSAIVIGYAYMIAMVAR